MKPLFDLCGMVCGAGLIFGGIVFWLSAALTPSSLVSEAERGHALEMEIRQSRARSAKLDRLSADLIAGKLSLQAAARQSQELHGEAACVAHRIRKRWSGESDAEAFARHLLMKARRSTRSAPAALRRLENEFEQLYPRAAKPGVDMDLLPMGPRRAGGAGPSDRDPVKPGTY